MNWVSFAIHDYSSKIFPYTFPNDESSDWIPSTDDFPKYIRPKYPQVINKIGGLVKDLFFLIGTFFSKHKHHNDYSTKINSKSEDTLALCVFLHGFRDRPAVLNNFYDAFTERGKNITIFHPKLKKGGNCPIDDAVDSVYKEVKKWSEKNRDKPIVFCGISNGARLAGYIASKLKIEGNVDNPIKVNAFSGPFFGTIRADQFSIHDEMYKLCRWSISSFIDPGLMKELAWGSEKAKVIIESMRTAAKVHGVSFDFYASWADWLVIPFVTSMPKNIEGAKYYILKGEGHGSILYVVRDQAVKDSIKFIENHLT